MHDLLFGACLEGENLELSLGLFQFWFRASALPCGHCWDVWGLCSPIPALLGRVSLES